MEIPRPRPKARKVRLAGLLLLLPVGVFQAQRIGTRDACGDLEAVLSEIDSGEPRVFYRQGWANVGRVDEQGGWQMTLYVGADSRFAPARFLVLVKNEKETYADLMVHSEVAGVSRLRGADLDRYLSETPIGSEIFARVSASLARSQVK